MEWFPHPRQDAMKYAHGLLTTALREAWEAAGMKAMEYQTDITTNIN